MFSDRIIESLIISAVSAAGTAIMWLFKTVHKNQSDLNAAFQKIRCLENKLKGEGDGRN